MGNYNRGDRGDRFSGGSRGFRKGGQSDRPTMYPATCSDCGKHCEVPFRPTGEKPVFCSICFGNKDTSNKSRSERRSSGRSSLRDKPMFRATCDKCHSACEVPFRPTGDKPVFCDNCFERPERSSGGGNKFSGADRLKKNFEILNNKLDSILEMLLAGTPAKKTAKEKTPVIKAVKKAAAPKKAVKKKAPAKKTVKKAIEKKKKKVKKAAAPKKNN